MYVCPLARSPLLFRGAYLYLSYFLLPSFLPFLLEWLLPKLNKSTLSGYTTTATANLRRTGKTA